MLANKIRPTLFYCNPNIYPAEEYAKRRDECRRFAHACGIDMVEDERDHEAWLNYVAGFENEPERGIRCRRCFEFRLARAADYASRNGFNQLTSTLASSRWKSLEQIIEAGKAATAPFGDVAFWEQNWRKGGLTERRAALLREHGFYNQLYCGCEFSMDNRKEK